jgi:hypothetical protein
MVDADLDLAKREAQIARLPKPWNTRKKSKGIFWK